ncbi:unnamed protein product [Paramecium octaurelia]|uniref:Transmembrane protein n=1 Tax=Paramecium octaurelia TaxID=43137 RepID=A0A8S1X1N2_PAROT|nr:unnamed protein product [Paramecium octaurelia]
MSSAINNQLLLFFCELPENPMATNLTLKQDKTYGGRLIWNLIIYVVKWQGFPFYPPLEATFGVNCFYALLWILFIFLAAKTQSKIKQMMKRFQMTPNNLQIQTPILFILMLFIYKESLDILLKTLQTFNNNEQLNKSSWTKLQRRNPKLMQYLNNSKIVLINSQLLQFLMELQERFQEMLQQQLCYQVCIGSFEQKDLRFDSNNTLKLILTRTQYFKKLSQYLNDEHTEREGQKQFVQQPVLFYNWGLDKHSFTQELQYWLDTCK